MPAQRNSQNRNHSKSTPRREPAPPTPDPSSPQPPSRSPSPAESDNGREARDHHQGNNTDPVIKASLREAARALALGKNAQNSSKYLYRLRQDARWIKRLLGPAVDIHNLFLYGPYCLDSEADLPELNAYGQAYMKKLTNGNRERIASQYEKLFAIIPSLEEDLEYFAAKEPRMQRFIQFLSDNADAGRRDDVKNIRRNIVDLLPANGENDDTITAKDQSKSGRGWYNIATAWQLCPVTLHGTFQDNPSAFSAQVVSGKRILRGGDFMAFLYPEDGELDLTNLERGFLRNDFLVQVFRTIFTGRLSAFSNTPGPSTVGRAPIAVAAKRTEVTPEMIAWAAVMAYFGLCSKDQWCLQDGGVNLADLYNEIVDAFEDADSEWAVETLAWWNSQVWNPTSEAGGRTISGSSIASKMKAQRAARKRAEDNSLE